MTESRNCILRLVMAGILLVSMFVVAGKGAIYVDSIKVERKGEICIVIDAGHGGGRI